MVQSDLLCKSCKKPLYITRLEERLWCKECRVFREDGIERESPWRYKRSKK